MVRMKWPFQATRLCVHCNKVPKSLAKRNKFNEYWNERRPGTQKVSTSIEQPVDPCPGHESAWRKNLQRKKTRVRTEYWKSKHINNLLNYFRWVYNFGRKYFFSWGIFLGGSILSQANFYFFKKDILQIYKIKEHAAFKNCKNNKNYSNQYSHVVPHHSTDWSRYCLTAEIGRDPVLSILYGRSL
jgi:hypothetical protein